MSPAINDNEPQNKRATSVDKLVGQRIREQRLAMGLSQQQLARIIGVTFQQAHKYERGLIPNPTDQNRCAQSRSPMDMIVQGCSTRRFQARQQWSTMSS
ncbi:helix-turn-helix domain-containing protein [Belnapia rosea]|uniref:helix-turn-helix domain-containing protein n=1 Tax=Belnapia rosea TaxID=938405 RepID=UPI000B8186B4|nr:helix-turn-helix transcriptional regulator [Belnapia rosea]